MVAAAGMVVVGAVEAANVGANVGVAVEAATAGVVEAVIVGVIAAHHANAAAYRSQNSRPNSPKAAGS